jgi:peptidyl-prolyl cis-trans isomerase A (cyclophilin A)
MLRNTFVGFGFWLLGCATAPAPAPPPTVVVPAEAFRTDQSAAEPGKPCTPTARPPRAIRAVATLQSSPDDPKHGSFGMQEAIAGMSGEFPLVAKIETSLGDLECELWDEVAPITVANFVGLARGVRPFSDPSNPGTPWISRPAFDGSSFHRVIPGFMIQGGDPTGTGRGGPGYVIPDEIDDTVHPDRAGLLYMANAGPNTNGMQFFVLDDKAPHLDGHYTAFGECEPTQVVSKIAANQDTRIERVSVRFEKPCRE